MSTVANHIHMFEQVRNIPYRIDLMDKSKDASCSSKAAKLQKLLADLGVESRRICCRFMWDTTPLPADLIAKFPGNQCGHEYLEVRVADTKWVTVDPTWDPALELLGFPVAEWNGQDATVLGVNPYETYSAAESAKIIKEIDAATHEDLLAQAQACGEFVRAFNAYLENHRAGLGEKYA